MTLKNIRSKVLRIYPPDTNTDEVISGKYKYDELDLKKLAVHAFESIDSLSPPTSHLRQVQVRRAGPEKARRTLRVHRPDVLFGHAEGQKAHPGGREQLRLRLVPGTGAPGHHGL